MPGAHLRDKPPLWTKIRENLYICSCNWEEWSIEMNLDYTTQGLWASARIDMFMGFQRDIGFPCSSM